MSAPCCARSSVRGTRKDHCRDPPRLPRGSFRPPGAGARRGYASPGRSPVSGRTRPSENLVGSRGRTCYDPGRPRRTTVPSFLDKLPLFPTAVIGSLPRPPWLLDLLQDHVAGQLAPHEWDRACDRAVPFAVALQETAGIDVITDGEWRREGYFQVFYERVEGFAPDLIPGRTRRWPAAVAPLRRRGPIAADGAAFLRRQTSRAIKVSLP